MTDGDHQYVIGTRLYVDSGGITRVGSLAADEGARLYRYAHTLSANMRANAPSLQADDNPGGIPR